MNKDFNRLKDFGKIIPDMELQIKRGVDYCSMIRRFAIFEPELQEELITYYNYDNEKIYRLGVGSK